MIKHLLTKLGRAGWENIWFSVMVHEPRCARSVRHDLGRNILPSSHLVNKYIELESHSVDRTKTSL